jgi:diguanylate cyclase (GGDEF)-like protein
VSSDAGRRRAHLEAYHLLEAVQGDDPQAALDRIPAAQVAARSSGWADVALVLQAAGTVHSLARGTDLGALAAQADGLVGAAEVLGAPALRALALAVRAVVRAREADTGRLMADASTAVALLDDATAAPVDRCAGYVVAAAAYNTLQLWELVDELYTAAGGVGTAADVAPQAPAMAVNQVLTRVEWGLALFENGETDRARRRMHDAQALVPQALTQPMPPLWRADLMALDVVIDLLCRPESPPSASRVEQLRAALVEGQDVEVLPLLDGALALAAWRRGEAEVATAAAHRLAPVGSASSGAQTFPLWVRATILAGPEPAEAVRAQADHAALASRLRWQSRRAVLAAARAQIAAERLRAEHDWLARAVNVDALTGLANRRAFDEWLQRTTPGAGVQALVLIDLDDFKVINDTHGHGCGDEVLRRIGRALAGCVRPGDLAVRHGGDEFAVLLQDPGLTVAAAHERARELREVVHGQPWHELAPGLAVTVSIGVAVAAAWVGTAEVPADDAGRLYAAADRALYAAKRDRSGLHVAAAS